MWIFFIWLRTGASRGLFKDGNELSGFVNRGQFDQLNDY
jgi:hypothetical protein